MEHMKNCSIKVRSLNRWLWPRSIRGRKGSHLTPLCPLINMGTEEGLTIRELAETIAG